MIKKLQKTILLSSLFLLANCGQNEQVSPPFDRNPKEVVTLGETSVEIYDFDNFEPFTQVADDRIHVINFWATWCVPCVKELPYFEQLGEKYPEVEVVLVSLDFSTKVESSLIPFIEDNKLKSEVIMLHDPNGNEWIPKIDKNWSGAIPATLIYKNKKSKFFEQSFNFAELEKEILKFKE